MRHECILTWNILFHIRQTERNRSSGRGIKMEFCVCAYCGEAQEQHNIHNFTCEFCGEDNSDYAGTYEDMDEDADYTY